MKAASPLLLALFLLSGASGLVYELVWTRELIFVFGGTTYAITTVLVAFMGGLGLGSYLAGRLAPKLTRPGAAYGFLEILIGLYALAVPTLLGLAQPMYEALYDAVGDTPALLTAARFLVGAFVLLLPACLMGATLPVLVRFVTARGSGLGQSVSVLYGVNALGAVVGVALTGFVLIPTFGLTRTTQIAAATNLIVGFAAIAMLRRSVASAPPLASTAPAAAPTPVEVRQAALVVFAASGFTAMVYQVMWTRTLAMVFGSSTYCFTSILAAFILGLSVGSLLVGRWVDRWRQPAVAMAVTQLLIGLTAGFVQPLYGLGPLLSFELIENRAEHYNALLFTQFMIIVAITCLPTFLMGAQFPLAARLLARGADDAAAATGRAYAVNTLGTILGSFLAGFVLLRLIGAQASIVLAATLNAGAGIWLLSRLENASAPSAARLKQAGLLGTVAVLAVAALAGSWSPELMSSGPFMGRGDSPATHARDYRVIYYGEGVDTTVAVAQSRQNPNLLTLSVNGKPDASTSATDLTTQILVGHLPMLLAPQRDLRVCVVGLGSGMTVGAVTTYPNIEEIDCAELSQEVILAGHRFSPYNYYVLQNPLVRMHPADGRNHLLLTRKTYDVIISEPSNPWVAGVANLFTREFFSIVRERLAPDGVFALWAQAYSFSPEDFRMIVRTLCDVFEFVTVWELGENDYALIAGRAPFRTPFELFRERLEAPRARVDLCRVGLGTLPRVLGHYFTTGQRLRDWVGDGPLHTDDRAQLEFSAPRSLYSSSGPQILERLVVHGASPFDEVILPPRDPGARQWIEQRLARVIAARAARVASMEEVITEGDILASGRELLRGYDLDPGAPALFTMLMALHRNLQRNQPALAKSPEGAALLTEIEARRHPVFADPMGGTLDDFVRELRAYAKVDAKEERWKCAYQYLEEALDIQPDNGDVIMELAWVLLQAGAPEEAAKGLEDAVARGVLTPERIAQMTPLAPLKEVPRLAAMLGGAAQSQATSTSAPASAPGGAPD